MRACNRIKDTRFRLSFMISTHTPFPLLPAEAILIFSLFQGFKIIMAND